MDPTRRDPADTGAGGRLGSAQVAPELRAGPREGPPSLSARLRSDTAHAHRAVEASLGLPYAISNRADCAACLGRFLRLYRPLEARLRQWGDWSGLGIDLDRRAHVPRLLADLDRFRVDPTALPDARPEDLPDLPAFAHGLGALYVLEGSTLGGQVILRHLSEGAGLRATAASFFGGRGSETVPMWRSFKAALDRYGEACPDQVPFVVCGAERSFEAIGHWMRIECWKPA